jgi:hypothetical protein
MTTENENSFEIISQRIASNWDNCVISNTNDSISLSFHVHTGIRLFISYKDGKGIPEIYLLCKTSSWHFEGDRTDLHDIISLSFAAFLRLFKIDCSVHVVNYINDFGKPDVEVDSVYLKVVQSSNSIIIGEDRLTTLNNIEFFLQNLLIFESLFWNSVGCSCEECRKKSGLTDFYDFNIQKRKKERIEEAILSSDKVNFCQRILPQWIYYRDFKRLITVIESQHLVTLFKKLLKYNNGHLKKIKGINGELFLSNNIKNYISNYSIKSATETLKKLENINSSQVEFIPFENCFLAIGNKYIIIKEAKCGFNQFRIEKEKIRKRHLIESTVLFPPSKFQWAYKVNDGRFEDLVKELLERDKFTSWIRKSGATRERDNGRDFLAEIIEITNVSFNGIGEPSIQSSLRKVVIQCKAYSKSVNKSDVPDIRDTIDFHKANGFFLVVLKNITNPLISYLENLKEQHGYYINWWTKDEIEIALQHHEDVLKKYADIVIPVEPIS